MSSLDPQTERDLVARIAMVFEQSGYPPVTGRVLGTLVVCDPPEQSSAQLAEYTGASKGAISQATRMLMTAGLIERVRRPGSRSAWFRMKEGAWNAIMHQEIVRLKYLRELAADGLRAMAGEPADRRRRLQEFHDLNAFFEAEFPALLERWDRHTKEQR